MKRSLSNKSLTNLRQRPRKLQGQNVNLDTAILALRSVNPTVEEMDYVLEGLGMKWAMRTYFLDKCEFEVHYKY